MFHEPTRRTPSPGPPVPLVPSSLGPLIHLTPVPTGPLSHPVHCLPWLPIPLSHSPCPFSYLACSQTVHSPIWVSAPPAHSPPRLPRSLGPLTHLALFCSLGSPTYSVLSRSPGSFTHLASSCSPCPLTHLALSRPLIPLPHLAPSRPSIPLTHLSLPLACRTRFTGLFVPLVHSFAWPAHSPAHPLALPMHPPGPPSFTYPTHLPASLPFTYPTHSPGSFARLSHSLPWLSCPPGALRCLARSLLFLPRSFGPLPPLALLLTGPCAHFAVSFLSIPLTPLVHPFIWTTHPSGALAHLVPSLPWLTHSPGPPTHLAPLLTWPCHSPGLLTRSLMHSLIWYPPSLVSLVLLEL